VRAITRRGFISLLALTLLFSLLSAPRAVSEGVPTLRALLISNDDFVSQPDTTPSSYNNLIALRQALLYDARGYSRIRVSVNQALTREGFADLAQQAFEGAGELDISLLYISTHGIKTEDGLDFAALLSDGETETSLTGQDIHAALKAIPGIKLILLDACFSGAAINKGLVSPLASSAFTGPDFKVLTSAGGQEPSFLWTDGAGTVQGGSFFAHALTEGISREGRYAADSNQDGLITLSELYRHQLRAYGASTPHVYPQNDDLVVFAYRSPYVMPESRLVTRLTVEDPVVRDSGDPLYFSYTLTRQARLAYQLVYMEAGNWQFQNPQSIADPGRGDGIVLPGRKAVSFEIQEGFKDLSGYLLLMLITVFEDRSRPLACVLTSVQTQATDPALSIDSVGSFNPGRGEEAAFILRHQGAIEYAARIENEAGETVAHLAFNDMSRPIHLKEEGSCLYWDGRLSDGSLAPDGKYRLAAKAVSGGTTYEAVGDWVLLDTK